MAVQDQTEALLCLTAKIAAFQEPVDESRNLRDAINKNNFSGDCHQFMVFFILGESIVLEMLSPSKGLFQYVK